MHEPPIVVIYAHPAPRRSRVNRPLAEALAALPHVAVRELYRLYVDYDIDVVAEQRLLSTSETVVLQFPVRWYSVPALLKLWIDEVLESGWAYGPGGRRCAASRCWWWSARAATPTPTDRTAPTAIRLPISCCRWSRPPCCAA